MNFKFNNKKITGILSVVPKNTVKFEEEIDNYNFSKKQSMKLKEIMGYGEHRIAEKNTCVSDLCVFGLKYLFNKGLLKKDEIDVLTLMTTTPDYFMPPTSNVIQGELGLAQDIICLDVNQGCTGFLVGLFQAFSFLEQEEINKVVLLNADVVSGKASKKDRSSYPLIGDAATITIIEESSGRDNKIIGNVKMDGSKYDAIIMPAGGLKIPYSKETSIVKVDSEGNARSLNDMNMDGKAIFDFVQKEVPPMIDDLLREAGTTKNKVDYFMFHQPNKFMLERLADKMEISYDKMPNNIVGKFGNSNGATIPVNLTYNLGDKLINNSYYTCLAGFGVGLVWSSMLVKMGGLSFCRIIEY
jgi:3-oxoacyl-[acyl-carrier-protein] synthase-3